MSYKDPKAGEASEWGKLSRQETLAKGHEPQRPGKLHLAKGGRLARRERSFCGRKGAKVRSGAEEGKKF